MKYEREKKRKRWKERGTRKKGGGNKRQGNQKSSEKIKKEENDYFRDRSNTEYHYKQYFLMTDLIISLYTYYLHLEK